MEVKAIKEQKIAQILSSKMSNTLYEHVKHLAPFKTAPV